MNETSDLATRLIVTTGRFTRAAARLAGTALPHAVWRALAQLDEHGSLRVTDLARLDRVAQPTTTRLVGQLREAGLVSTMPDPRDARVSRVALTDQGRARLAELREGAGGEIAARLDTLTAAERETIDQAIALLSRLMEPSATSERNPAT